MVVNAQVMRRIVAGFFALTIAISGVAAGFHDHDLPTDDTSQNPGSEQCVSCRILNDELDSPLGSADVNRADAEVDTVDRVESLAANQSGRLSSPPRAPPLA